MNANNLECKSTRYAVSAVVIIAMIASLFIMPMTAKADSDENDKVIKYKVKLDANKGKIGKKKTKNKSVTVGKKYGKFPTVKRSGYKFRGWYTKKTGGSKITKNTKVTKKSKHTLYAKWLKKGKGKTCTDAEYKHMKNGYTESEINTIVGASPAYSDYDYVDIGDEYEEIELTISGWYYGNYKSRFVFASFVNGKMIWKGKGTEKQLMTKMEKDAKKIRKGAIKYAEYAEEDFDDYWE